MPQMAPINWMSMSIFFIVALAIFSNMNYFIFKYQPSKTHALQKKATPNNWSW
uniref:ATP synthase complex subunit 8 n=1 Tax=Exema canadensis TaxID=294585 RepID=U3KZY1_9CUCU|nr:ATP synthase F0 subunit 8 [Exema canadensis]